ncbi:MAG: L-threonylcarbamoyladenylate synthase [Chitinispirillia bacterium]|nr:L-threonylcarbamoyladenylate synthase [Chitinispirillia bacterium]MCL2242749.1 L-threonylcarbamoyladenylate synthase [Chitinispirillia bacterium]
MRDVTINAGEQVRRAAEIIRGGGVVAFPTETVYGLGANAFDELAAARVFEVKRRPFFDPLIIHIANKGQLGDLVTDIPPLAEKLTDRFWPGPLTVVLPKKTAVPDIITSGLPGAAVRMPSNNIALQLISAAGVPIAAPSANLFGYVSPTSAEHVRSQLGDSVDMVIDGGECDVGIESTIISFMGEQPTLLRPGGTALEDIEDVIGKVTIPANSDLKNQSPGRSDQHYATSIPLVLVDDITGINDVNAGLIALAPNSDIGDIGKFTKVEYLSSNGDLREAACNLFAAMRRLDNSGVGLIAALPIPKTGLGLAINDRLARASRKGVHI